MGGGLGGAAAAAAAAPGVDPFRFGYRRAADAGTVQIDAPALYGIFNPVGLGNEWTVDEVGRVSNALVGLSLSFSAPNLSQTLRALDRAVFDSPVALTSTLDLAAADVAQGNNVFSMYGGVVNDSLDYHLWPLALSMGSRYKPRPMHTVAGYDSSSLYSLRQIRTTVVAPMGSTAATATRYAHVKLLPRSAAHQM